TWEVNGRALGDYFPRLSHQQHAQEPLVVAQLQGRFDVKVNVEGGGESGQAGAIRLGIARALLRFDPELRGTLRQRGLLTRVARGRASGSSSRSVDPGDQRFEGSARREAPRRRLGRGSSRSTLRGIGRARGAAPTTPWRRAED